MEYRTLEDPENVSEAQVDKKIIPAITDLDVPLVINSRLKKLTKAIQRQRRSHGRVGMEQWKTKMSPYHQES